MPSAGIRCCEGSRYQGPHSRDGWNHRGLAPSRVDVGYRAGELGVSALMDGVPGVRDVATLTAEQFS